MTKKILNAHVHRLHKGVLETYGPGDKAPDWVTNAALFTVAANEVSDDTTPTAPAADGDGLDDLSGKELANIADGEGIAKTGSKKVLIDRIRGHRAAAAGIALTPVAEETGLGNDRDVLVARALELGFDDVDDNTSEVELQALIDSKE